MSLPLFVASTRQFQQSMDEVPFGIDTSLHENQHESNLNP